MLGNQIEQHAYQQAWGCKRRKGQFAQPCHRRMSPMTTAHDHRSLRALPGVQHGRQQLNTGCRDHIGLACVAMSDENVLHAQVAVAHPWKTAESLFLALPARATRDRIWLALLPAKQSTGATRATTSVAMRSSGPAHTSRQFRLSGVQLQSDQ